ncbi:MAG: ABC transporter substrate-binding protein [Clostridia bacterium]|nr:ABC transporter substrate-binding protein [Clostridia bacterium]
MKNVFKKFLCFLISALIFSAFSSCTENEPNSDINANALYKIGICQFIEHKALNSATEGFKAALSEKLGQNVTFDYQNAAGDKTNAASICSLFASEKYDLIFANSTNALAAAAEATSEIPVVACSVTDFESTLGLENFTGKTGFNVTGCSDLLPLEEQAEVIYELFPDAKKVGILYCSSEINSKYQADEITKHLTSYGFKCQNYTFVDTTDVTLVTQQAASECDVIYTPTDNTVASNTQAINNILEPAKIPLVAGNNDVALDCGVATVGIEYYDLGYEAGLMAYEILAEGKDPAEMEIKYADEYLKRYIPERCQLLGITVPEDYMKIE